MVTNVNLSTRKIVGIQELEAELRETKRANEILKDEVLSAAIQTIIDESVFNDNYGVPRMQMALALKGQKVGILKLRRIMLKMGLIHERKRRPKGQTKAITEIQEKENLIRQDFSADKPYTSYLQIYLRSNASMRNCTFHQSSAALMGKSYRVLTYYNTVRIYMSNPSGLPPTEYRRILLD